MNLIQKFLPNGVGQDFPRVGEKRADTPHLNPSGGGDYATPSSSVHATGWNRRGGGLINAYFRSKNNLLFTNVKIMPVPAKIVYKRVFQ